MRCPLFPFPRAFMNATGESFEFTGRAVDGRSTIQKATSNSAPGFLVLGFRA